MFDGNVMEIQCNSTKKRQHYFDILDIMLPLFRAVVKFCSTNRQFTKSIVFIFCLPNDAF